MDELLACLFDWCGWAARFPHSAANANTIAAYARVLADCPPDALAAACVSLAATEDGFPSPPRIRREVAQLCGLVAPTWEEALAEVRAYARWERDYLAGSRSANRPELHPTVARTLDLMGGARALGDEPSSRAQFRDLYTSAASRRLLDVVRPGGLRSAVLPAELLPPLDDLTPSVAALITQSRLALGTGR